MKELKVAKEKEKQIKISEVFKKIPNRFILALAVAKRARQIAEGAKPLVEIHKEDENSDIKEEIHPILTALREINEGKLDVMMEKDKDVDLEYIEEVERYFETNQPKEEVKEEELSKKAKKEKEKDKETKSRTKTKSLAA